MPQEKAHQSKPSLATALGNGNASEPSDPATSPDPSLELTTLRDILFGQAQQQMQQRLAEIEKTMLEKFDAVQRAIDKQFSDLQKKIEQTSQHHESQLAASNSSHEDAEASLREYADKLASDIEMTDTNSRQEADEIHKRIEQELQSLTDTYDKKFVETLAKLDSVTKELSSSKTDRKTLANLLATMAVNLETDQ
ncbi:hypothetical protein [Alteromonas halophila]|uniref:Uncharacterized protein n=1 Tax=Alteromonas halophila TaxID=516698 RepID=A0A918MXX9_9ALTE|nr:hypothetical protein [Alteromonas halophila]GGW81610.1 hypothetical protein GCM10007391_13530 [Alteromonas halophila]